MFSCVSVSTVNSSNLAGRSVSPWASQVALVVKNLTANAGDIRDPGWIPGLGRSPGGGHGNPLQYSCLENPHGQRSLTGSSPWGHKELDMTETKHSIVCHLRDLGYFM